MFEKEIKQTHHFLKASGITLGSIVGAVASMAFGISGKDEPFLNGKIWWLVVFSVTLVACILLIMEVYKKWERSPVIVSFATRETPIYEIPFPAVTICPESKFNPHHYNHTRAVRRKRNNITLDSITSDRFEYASLICDKDHKVKYSENKTFDPEIFFEQMDYMKAFDILSSNGCSFMGGLCKDHLSNWVDIVTDEGMCKTFNMLDRTDIYRDNVEHYSNYLSLKPKQRNSTWTMDKGYPEEAGLNPHPTRALLAGAKNSLTIILRSNIDIDLNCKSSLEGFRVTLHTPMRIPSPSSQYFRVPLNQVVVAAIHPTMITTSESVKMYNPERRECYFQSERHLKYFKAYTQLNCQLECLTQYTLKSCGCVNFFMPRESNQTLCGDGKIKCMKLAESRLQMGDKFKKFLNVSQKFRKMLDEAIPHCDCLPLCTDLSYEVETSQSKFEWKKRAKSLVNKSSNASETEYFYYLSKLTIYFKSSRFITSQRHELYGPTDFLANFGGLLGLFTGFSVLSFMEIIYFLTVRLICNTRLYGYWAGVETKGILDD